MGYNLLINGIYWGYNPLILTIDPITSWDIQGAVFFSSFYSLFGWFSWDVNFWMSSRICCINFATNLMGSSRGHPPQSLQPNNSRPYIRDNYQAPSSPSDPLRPAISWRKNVALEVFPSDIPPNSMAVFQLLLLRGQESDFGHENSPSCYGNVYKMLEEISSPIFWLG